MQRTYTSSRSHCWSSSPRTYGGCRHPPSQPIPPTSSCRSRPAAHQPQGEKTPSQAGRNLCHKTRRRTRTPRRRSPPPCDNRTSWCNPRPLMPPLPPTPPRRRSPYRVTNLNVSRLIMSHCCLRVRCGCVSHPVIGLSTRLHSRTALGCCTAGPSTGRRAAPQPQYPS